MKKIITFGSINMDLSIQTNRIPNNGETIYGSDFFLSPGGKGANQTVAAAKSGAQTYMIGGLGDDVYGIQLLNTLKGYCVNCNYIESFPNTTSGVAVIIRSKGDNRIILNGGANHLLDHRHIDPVLANIASPGDIFLTQFENDYDTILYALAKAKDKELWTIFNPAPANEIPDTIYPKIKLLIINQWECKFLSGIYPTKESDYKQAITFFQQKGVHSILITLGSEGSVFGNKSTYMFIPSISVQSVDTTAAGDTYIGALAYSLSCNHSIKTSMEYATMAAALTVSKQGAQESIPTKQEVENFKLELYQGGNQHE
ncbi:ribokinase [Virgibacillus proomii]|uniref:ribokinase n=1 Tax=Virgibacillus proomii TaxID=84407 RepID=UPI0009855A53|nr:ribokinase [Virgibacillus proomii]